MKKLSVFPLLAALAVFVSCQKQQTEEERKAEVERQVQERLAAERAETDKKRLEDERASEEARANAMADAPSSTVAEAPATTETEEVVTATADGGSRAETQSTAAYGMFYEKLDPYGEWRETSDYGYVWQPREAETSRDWRPYTEGRWVYSDAGWTWVSDEKFGWATYHYGRWVRLRRVGWVWVPGREWAPAWVSWRTSKDYVGWAPLPPEARFDRRSGIQNWADSYYDIGPDQYSFVASNDFGTEHVRRAVVPTERNINIVIETKNVTRITFSNTAIVNEGPNYDELRSRSQQPIERYRLRRDRNTEGPARITGGELEVSVPVLSETRNIVRPRRVKERVTEVNVDNGWTSISDRSAAERARTKMRAEATPPPNAPLKKFVPPTETAASSTPAATAATSPAAVLPSATPTFTATPTAAATSNNSATASPVGSASPRTRPSASIRPRPNASPTAAATTAPAAVPPSPTPTPAATLTTSPASSPVASASPRTRPSPTARPRLSPSPTPAATTTPAASSTPAPAVSTTPRTRPSPSIPARLSPTPVPTASAPMTTPTVIPRRTLPPVSTKPVATPPAETESSIKPVPTVPPVKRPPIPPRPTLPTPTAAPETNEAAQPPAPRDIPRRTIPPRLTPPPTTQPVTTPAIAPSSPAVTDERGKNRRPPRPVPPATESGTPSPTPSTPPR